jgi:hypothetical protein
MIRRRIAAVLVLLTGELTMPISARADGDVVQAVDFAGVQRVLVHGEGARVELSAVAAPKGELRLSTEGWAPSACKVSAEVRHDGDTLDIRLVRNGVRLIGQCDITLALELPQGLSLAIDQDGTVTQLNGAFGDVAVKSPKAVVNLDGSARNVDIDCRDASVDLAFRSSLGMDGVRINARKLVADIGFRSDTVLSYAVSAPLSVFTPEFANSKDAHPRVEITSELFKGSIYALSAPRPE